MNQEKLVIREGRDWMELRQIDPRGQLWLVTDGTAGVPGDVVRLPGTRLDLSPFDVEIVVDGVTRIVLLPESGTPSSPFRRAVSLIETLEAAGLTAQARIVREWLRRSRGEGSQRHAA